MGLDRGILAVLLENKSLTKAENPEAYSKLAREGLLLGHPVKIKGQSKRSDNDVPYHSTIKFFNHEKDSPEEIHKIASQLKMHPPHPEATEIEPGKIKSRAGDDIYVIKLHGPHIDKMQEHHKKFSHMGHKENYKHEPHISVSKETHDRIKSSGAKTAHEAGIEFGPAELKRGPKTLKTYGPKKIEKHEVFDDKMQKSETPPSKNEDAHALLNRKEDKYFLPRHFLEKVVSELSNRLALGDIDTDTRYTKNRTIYLDDKDLNSFKDCVSKNIPRTKVRIRQYSPNNLGWEEVAYVEFKVKEDDGQTRKIRVRIPSDIIDELCEGRKIFFDEKLVNINRDLDRKVLENRVRAINNSISTKGLKKQLEVQYERRAYSGKNIRITIDDNLSFLDVNSIDPTVKDLIDEQKGWNKFIKPYIKASWENPLIMEVKTDEDVPHWIKRLLKEVEAEKKPFSKYSAALVTYLKTDEKEGKILNISHKDADLSEEEFEDVNKSEAIESLEKSHKNVDIAVVVLRDGNFVLVGRRRRNKKWGLPGGRNEKDGESNKATAIRELKEETGLDLKSEDLSLIGIREIKNNKENKRIHIYTAKFPGGEPTTENDPDEEFTKWHWIRCDEGQLPEKILEDELSPPTEAAFDELEMTKNEESKSRKRPSHKAKIAEPHFIFSAENPVHKEKNELGLNHEQTLQHLRSKGFSAHEVQGHYGSPERSILVHDVSPEHAEKLHQLASKLGQDSSLYSTGKEHEMRFHHGENAGKSHYGSGTVWHEKKPKDFYTTLPNNEGHFTHNLDMETLHPSGKLKKTDQPTVSINPEHGSKIAEAYEKMPHNPEHPDVKSAYGALINETGKQFKDILGSGMKISRIQPGQENPYKTSKEMHHDIEHNKHLWYFPTEQGFGSGEEAPKNHPMLAPSKFTHGKHQLLANDVFRIVHDINGHHIGGKSGFGPTGEHKAYLTHKQMYGPQAQRALATETMGQNNWVNFGPHGEKNRKNPSKTKFAEQKAGLLPEHIINGEWHNAS